jgi:hypothetical protein
MEKLRSPVSVAAAVGGEMFLAREGCRATDITYCIYLINIFNTGFIAKTGLSVGGFHDGPVFWQFFGVFLAKNGIENLGENHQKTTKKSPKNHQKTAT